MSPHNMGDMNQGYNTEESDKNFRDPPSDATGRTSLHLPDDEVEGATWEYMQKIKAEREGADVDGEGNVIGGSGSYSACWGAVIFGVLAWGSHWLLGL